MNIYWIQIISVLDLSPSVWVANVIPSNRYLERLTFSSWFNLVLQHCSCFTFFSWVGAAFVSLCLPVNHNLTLFSILSQHVFFPSSIRLWGIFLQIWGMQPKKLRSNTPRDVVLVSLSSCRLASIMLPERDLHLPRGTCMRPAPALEHQDWLQYFGWDHFYSKLVSVESYVRHNSVK